MVIDSCAPRFQFGEKSLDRAPHLDALIVVETLAGMDDLSVRWQFVTAEDQARRISHDTAQRRAPFRRRDQDRPQPSVRRAPSPRTGISRRSARMQATCRISAAVDWIGKFLMVRGLIVGGHCMYQPNGVPISSNKPA